MSDEEHFHTERSTQQSHGGELDHFDIHYWSKVKQMVGPLINYTAASIANYSPWEADWKADVEHFFFHPSIIMSPEHI